MKERASAPVFTAVCSANQTNDRKEAHTMLYLGVDLLRNRSVVTALAEDGR